MATKTNSAPSAEKILKDAKWNNGTIYTGQISYIVPDNGYKITVVWSSELQTRREVEQLLVEKVKEYYGE